MATRKTRLGRGLGSLISSGVSHRTAEEPAPKKTTAAKKAARKASPARKGTAAEPMLGANGFFELQINKIDPNPYQPRREFDEAHLRELAESIRSEGLMQPIVVREVDGRYQLIAGERRWRACQALKLKTIPARVMQAGDASSATMSLIENLQREGLNPVEEAQGYASLIRDFDLTQEAVSERVGKARASVANALRLLQLDQEIQGYLAKGILSTGHAKVLLGVNSADERKLLARRIIESSLSVRELEKVIQRLGKPGKSSSSRSIPAAEATAIADLQKQLEGQLKTRVQIKHAPKKGRLVIEYYGNEDLQRILEHIGIKS